MPKSALLLVDLQNDFCAGGALAVPGANQTIRVANQLIAHFASQGKKTIASQDWHPAGHGSFASTQGAQPFSQGALEGLTQTWWPDHCVQHSSGAAFVPELNGKAIDHIVQKGIQPETDSYSAFFDNGHRYDTGLHAWLGQQAINTLIVMGLATDYCVKFTVTDALALGYQVIVITDGCRGVNIQPEDSDLAMQQMADRGARLMTLAQFLRQ